MQRRHVSQTLRLGLAAWSLCGWTLVHAQQPGGSSPGVVQTGPSQTGGGATGPGGGQLPRPQMDLQEHPDVGPILTAWERYTRNIERLHGTFDRYVYDATFLVEKRAVGEFWYEAPDKGRLDFHPFPEERMPPANDKGQRLNPNKRGPNDFPYTVVADGRSKWICRGDALLAINVDEKSYMLTEIPPHLQGKNITASPLPFLFGMNAAEMRKRFFLSIGPMHDPDGSRTGRRQLHLVAAPRLQALASEFSRAEVLLDPGTTLRDSQDQPIFVPFAIKMLDPTGQQETVYTFHLQTTKVNEGPLFFGNPFRSPALWQGYKLLEHRRLTLEEDPTQRTAEQAPTPQTPALTR